MSGLLCVLPVIGPSTTEQCLRSLLAPNSASGLTAEDLLVVDNSREGWMPSISTVLGADLRAYRDPDGHNLGVARSWNIGAREVVDRGLDYLVILSASMLFGPELHCTWRWQLEQFWDENVIEAEGHSWHAIAFHRRVFERIGYFCEGFWPGYVEALDFSYRMRQVGWEGGWRRVWFNALSQGHALHLPYVECPWKPLNDLYVTRWGGEKGAETFTLPYGVRPLDYDADADTPVPVLAARYGITNWW